MGSTCSRARRIPSPVLSSSISPPDYIMKANLDIPAPATESAAAAPSPARWSRPNQCSIASSAAGVSWEGKPCWMLIGEVGRSCRKGAGSLSVELPVKSPTELRAIVCLFVLVRSWNLPPSCVWPPSALCVPFSCALCSVSLFLVLVRGCVSVRGASTSGPYQTAHGIASSTRYDFSHQPRLTWIPLYLHLASENKQTKG
ncbi:hypothetical protein J3F83DRAFT_744687 [Trichoderma novae-zelandiae]